jgi:capsid protein
MVKTIQFEENRVATIKKWIKEDGMEKQEAKDRFQKEMDAMVREALGLPDETEQEKEYRLRAKATQEENKRRAAELDADSEE